MDDGTWLPMSRMQSFQLVRAATIGVGGIEVVNGYGRATDEGLADIVTREAQTTEVAGSHASLVVHAKQVAEVIEKAALAK